MSDETVSVTPALFGVLVYLPSVIFMSFVIGQPFIVALGGGLVPTFIATFVAWLARKKGSEEPYFFGLLALGLMMVLIWLGRN